MKLQIFHVNACANTVSKPQPAFAQARGSPIRHDAFYASQTAFAFYFARYKGYLRGLEMLTSK